MITSCAWLWNVCVTLVDPVDSNHRLRWDFWESNSWWVDSVRDCLMQTNRRADVTKPDSSLAHLHSWTLAGKSSSRVIDPSVCVWWCLTPEAPSLLGSHGQGWSKDSRWRAPHRLCREWSKSVQSILGYASSFCLQQIPSFSACAHQQFFLSSKRCDSYHEPMISIWHQFWDPWV